MKLIGGGKVKESAETGGVYDGGVGGGGEGGDGGDRCKRKVVVVGVKFDQQSRELLTWALMKVAEPGDRVIALHVLSSSNEEQSTPLALVTTFDSLLSVYEGFCHLKEVDLKLKVSRGSCVRKVLVREAKRHQSATVITGTSKSRHLIFRSPASVAKYCARKLSHDFSVFAVDNGKTVFRREATPSSSGDFQGSLDIIQGNLAKRRSIALKVAAITKYFGCTPTPSWKEYYSSNQFAEDQESDADSGADSPLAFVSFCKSEPSVSALTGIGLEQQGELRRGWTLLQRVLLRKHRIYKASTTNASSSVCWISEIPFTHSSKAIHPAGVEVEHGGDLVGKDERISFLSVENGAAFVPNFGRSYVACNPHSPERGLIFLPKELEGLHERYSSTCRLFSYLELLSATSNFNPERMVGKGGSSQVFRGSFPDGQELAVKILKPSVDVLREFRMEIEIIPTIKHKNIISLIGYCFEDGNLILVYDYLPRGSLEENLHGSKDAVVAFGWEERYKVALGVAEALNHLHNESSQPVIHRDVKSSNILLSYGFEPQILDLLHGLQMIHPIKFTLTLQELLGGLGSMICMFHSYLPSNLSLLDSNFFTCDRYLAPEYFMHGKVTEKIDVYAYGVVLLELLSGRKPIDNKNAKGPESLVMWASPILQDWKISQLLDPRIGGEYVRDQIERMVLAATLCIRRAPQYRPRVSLILKLLQGDTEVTTWAKQQVNDSSVDRNASVGERFLDDIQSFLKVAFLDVDDDDDDDDESPSVSSPEQNISFSSEEYLQGRWSRSPASTH
ncbi:hypothetical protein Dimus_021608 [Dionaea muscipula]